MKQFSQDENNIKNEKCIEHLTFILKVYEKLAITTGQGFAKSLGIIYFEMINTYMAYSKYISQEVQQKGANIMNFTLMKKMRTVRSDIIKVIASFIEHCSDQKLVAEKLL